MPSKKQKAKNRRNVSTVNWVENKDGTHSIAVASKVKPDNTQKGNSWVQLLNPDSGKSARKYTTDENANTVQFEEMTLNEVENKSNDDIAQIQRLIDMKRGKLEMCTLPSYDIPKEIWNSAETGKQLRFGFPIEKCRSSADYYVKTYETMVYLEEAAQTLFVQSFNQDDVDFSYTGENQIFYFMKEKRMAEINGAIDENLLDCFVLEPHKKSDFFTVERYSGQIKRKSAEKIFVQMSEESFSKFNSICMEQSFDIRFCLNRTPYQLQHFALDILNEQRLFTALINNPKYDETGNSSKTPPEILIDFSPNLKLNPEQKLAVQSIVNATSKPLPFVLFGPPGTGKTKTLVAAIEKIVRLTDKNVLVCGQSNAACDEIATRLIPALTEDEMFRMYALSYDVHKIKSDIEPYSNRIGKEFHYPPLQFIMKYRVVICTLCTAGTLTRANISPKHFSYVIIDECASAHETMALIPIAGLCTETGKVHANIVVAGDPKQLDAVTKSDQAKKLGFGTSFMEHLFERPLYKCDPETNEFCGKYITQLIRNYRSHESILKIPNELFYNGTLLAKASDDATNWFVNNSLLPSKKFPIIFRSVQGNSERSDANKSMFNTNEVNMVMEYIDKLLKLKLKNGERISQSDIGVVTPYKMQRRCISQACHRGNLDDITIGTAEVFQGQERPIIIVSTVRSGGNKLGFVNNPRRFNVMITRAKCLLVIVGDPHLLQYCSNWRKLITFCLENNALVQSRYRYPSI
ncbi:putative helicase mov-10-B.1 [Sitodiplosis mosellana]|uniref:putative helicase mov-10-B.1 n=1 Tax=Sitodiplosis mosellana TaxID=263140 RepID=UPI002444CBEF|nr:putative helicase mov-10-B.1 [Sitodiplosis mosellana]